MKHVIMVNPVSGNKRGLKYAQIVQKLLKKYTLDSEIIVSTRAGELKEKAEKLAKKRQTRFYSIGGDGTLNEVVSGIVGTNSEVVVLPCGTGNDFAKYFNKYKSLRKIILTSMISGSQKCDVIKLNNDRYCINILNAGFDALVAYNMNKFRWVPFATGTAKYNLSIVYTLFTNRNYKLKIKTNKFSEEQNCTLVALTNGRYYGGGVCPCPESRPDDGKLSICRIKATTILTKLILLPKYKNCEHLDLSPALIDNDITSLKITSNKGFPLSIDGEIIMTDNVEAKILKEAVNIVKIGEN